MHRNPKTFSRFNRLVAAAVGLAFLAAGCSGGSLSADAGEDIDVAVGESPNFDGYRSSGDITNYQWVIREAPASMPGDVDKAIRESMSECSFTLEASMIAEEVGSWTIELLISDADGNTSTDQVMVTVAP